MLKKSDLASQFELVVKQEIKNYQDSLHYINSSINEILKSIDLLQREVNRIYSIVDSNKTIQKIENARIECTQRDLSNDIAKLSSSLEEISQDNNKRVVESFKISIKSMMRSQENTDDLSNLKQEVESLEKLINDRCDVIADSVNQQYNKCRKEIAASNSEILSRPSDSEIVKKCLEDKIHSYKIDSEAVLKEVKILNRAVFTQEKKIENIYTLIKRMQEKG